MRLEPKKASKRKQERKGGKDNEIDPQKEWRKNENLRERPNIIAKKKNESVISQQQQWYREQKAKELRSYKEAQTSENTNSITT